MKKDKKSELDLHTFEMSLLGQDYLKATLRDDFDVEEGKEAQEGDDQEVALVVHAISGDGRTTDLGKAHWMLLALIAHAGWGTYPVLARYLQTVAKLPSMSLLVTGNGMVALLTLLVVAKRRRFLSILRLKMMPLMMVVTIVRVTTNMLSPRFTMAAYVQVTTLMAPFMVALFNTCFLQDPLPPFTVPALVLCTTGALMMVMSGIVPLEFDLSPTDVAGIALGFTSAVFLAIYMILVKKVLSDNPVKGEELLFFLTCPTVLTASMVSFMIGEDWSPWLHLTVEGWAAFGVFSVCILLMGNLLQISSIRHLGAPVVSTLLPFRLISALVFSALILHEELTDSLQFFGAFVVLATVTVYMYKARKQEKPG